METKWLSRVGDWLNEKREADCSWKVSGLNSLKYCVVVVSTYESVFQGVAKVTSALKRSLRHSILLGGNQMP